MKVLLKSNRKTVEFIDGITKVNSNDVMWQFFKVQLEEPLALRESLWILFTSHADVTEITHPFLAAPDSNGEYYAQIPPEIIKTAGEWDFQLFVRQYSTTNIGKYIQYASNVYTFTVEEGLPIINSVAVTYDTIAALYRSAREIIQRFYNVDKVIIAHANAGTYETVKVTHLTGCKLIDWGDGIIEDADGKTSTEYTHTYKKADNYTVKLFNVTDIGANAFKGFKGIYDLELNSGLLSIGANAFNGCAIDKLTIPKSVKYLSNCFSKTDVINVIEINQVNPNKFNENAFKHFLHNLPETCTVIVPRNALYRYEDTYITKSQPSTFSLRSYSAEGLEYTTAYIDGEAQATLISIENAENTNINIPSSVVAHVDELGEEAECTVVGIANGVFTRNTKITGVNIPDTVKSIEEGIFSGCTNLEEVTLGEGITVIPKNTFRVCKSLAYVQFNGEITSMGDNAFNGCAALGTFEIPETVETLGSGILTGCTALESITLTFLGSSTTTPQPLGWLFGATLYKENSSKVPSSLTSVVINGGKIASGAFYECANLTVITLPDDIESIPDNAFTGCTALEYFDVYGYSYIKKIGDNAFEETSIKKVKIGDSVTEIGINAFLNTPIETVDIYSDNLSIGNYAFKSKGTLYYIDLYTDNPPTLGTGVFDNANSELLVRVPLGKVAAYESNEYWAQYADRIVNRLIKLDTPSLTITNEGLAQWKSDNAKGYEYTLKAGKNTNIVNVGSDVTSIYLNDGESIRVRAIGDNKKYTHSSYTAYQTYTAINVLSYTLINNSYYKVVGIGTVTGTVVSIPSSYRGKPVKSVGENAFKGNANITNVSFQNTITEIGAYAFNGCTGLTRIAIPNSVNIIGAYAFKGCTSIKSIVLSEQLRVIPDECFAETSIESINIPENVISIGTNAFNSTTLENVTITSANPFSIGSNAFGANVKEIYVPSESITEYKQQWQDYEAVIFEHIAKLDLELSANGTYYIVKGIGNETNTDIIIPNTYNSLPVKEIADNAFYGKQITSVSIPVNVTKIGNNAFNGSKINELSLSEFVEEIGSSAFANCDNLTAVTVSAVNPPTLGENAFANCPNLTNISVPVGTTDAYREAWDEYADYFPDTGGGDSGGGDSGDNGDNGGEGGSGGEGGGEDEGGDEEERPTIPKLSKPSVQIDYNGLAHWYAENAKSYKYRLNKGAEISTTAQNVQLLDGQTISVKAVGDGINYTDSVYSAEYVYIKDFLYEPDEPNYPQLEDIEVLISPFDAFASHKEMDARLSELQDHEEDTERRVTFLEVEKQDKTDRSLNTNSKTVPGAINELDEKTKTQLSKVTRNGQFVKEFKAEDLLKEANAYAESLSLEAFYILEELPEAGQPNKLYLIAAGDGAIFEKWIWTNIGEDGETLYGWKYIGTAEIQGDLENCVKYTDIPNSKKPGPVKYDPNVYGIYLTADGLIKIAPAGEGEINAQLNTYMPITPKHLSYAILRGMAYNKLTMTDEEKTSSCDFIGAIQQEYVDNLPVYLSLTEEQKALWRDFIFVSIGASEGEYKNSLLIATETYNGNAVYGDKGYKINVRLSSSGVATSENGEGMLATGFIKSSKGDSLDGARIRTRGFTAAKALMNPYIISYNENGEKIKAYQWSDGSNIPGADEYIADFTLDSDTYGTGIKYIRISASATGDKFPSSVIIIDEKEDSETEECVINKICVGEVFAPSPQLPADGSETADFNGGRDYITPDQIYEYIDALLPKYPRFIAKEVMGKDASGTYDWCRYVCSRRAYDAWQNPNYPPMYAWSNGSTTIYSTSVSPRIGDTLYTTAYIGTAKGTVTAVSNANQTRTVGGVVYTRDKSKDVEPTLVYTETAYSPYFSSNYAGYKNGIYDNAKNKISTISRMSDGTLTGENGVAYIRYPLGDRNSQFEEIPAIVIGANEHGTGGDPATPAMINARMIKDLCECKNADNQFLNLLKNEYMMVFCPVVNPWGLHKANQSYYNSNGVNLDRNFDTPGWGNDTKYPQGDYGGSENETQYFMNTLVASKCKIAMCNHSYGHGIDNETGEAASAGICSYMLGAEKPEYTEALLKIAEVMSANYNLVFNQNSDIATPTTSAKTRSYIEWIGADAVALEMNSRDGFITDPNNDAKGKQFTSRVMEAAYTQLLQVLYMMITKRCLNKGE